MTDFEYTWWEFFGAGQAGTGITKNQDALCLTCGRKAQSPPGQPDTHYWDNVFAPRKVLCDNPRAYANPRVCIIRGFNEPIETAKPSCTCGAAKCGYSSSMCSSWCDLKRSAA